jgi:hypothetical protein
MAATQNIPGAAGSRADAAPSGWTTFAAIMLLVAGSFNVCWGLAAVLNDQVLTVGGRGVLVLDFTTWGWVHLVIGVIMLIVAWGLFGLAGWARWLGIGIAALNMVVQVVVMTTFPLWALVVIALDAIVIYQLTVHYSNWD